MEEHGAAVLLLDTDLFFVVKVRTTLKHAGYDVQTARSLVDFTRRLAADSPALALVNTAIAGVDWRAAIVAARAANIPVIAFGSHVDTQTQQEARQAGATRVIANSRLAADLPNIVARALRASTQTTDSSADDVVSAGSDAPQQEALPPEPDES
jgi:DNA-binding NtrC family response regulator